MNKALAMLVATALAASVFAAESRAASYPSPQQAARTAVVCLRSFGWRARLLQGNDALRASHPRNFHGVIVRPWLLVAWYDSPAMDGVPAIPTWDSHLSWGLNKNEKRVAMFCRKAGWR